jgi:hypothetical protein
VGICSRLRAGLHYGGEGLRSVKNLVSDILYLVSGTLVSDMGELARELLDGQVLPRRHVHELQAMWDEHLEEDRLEVLEAPQVAFLVLGSLVKPRPRQHEVLS